MHQERSQITTKLLTNPTFTAIIVKDITIVVMVLMISAKNILFFIQSSIFSFFLVMRDQFLPGLVFLTQEGPYD